MSDKAVIKQVIDFVRPEATPEAIGKASFLMDFELSKIGDRHLLFLVTAKEDSPICISSWFCSKESVAKAQSDLAVSGLSLESAFDAVTAKDGDSDDAVGRMFVAACREGGAPVPPPGVAIYAAHCEAGEKLFTDWAPAPIVH
jgi:hypothetical protein